MANSFKGDVAYIDTVSSNVDVASSMFGTSTAPVIVKEINFVKPTQNDEIIVKDNSGNVIAQLKANATNQDLKENFGGCPIRCQGIKLLSADQTKNSGVVLISFA